MEIISGGYEGEGMKGKMQLDSTLNESICCTIKYHHNLYRNIIITLIVKKITHKK